MKCPHCTGEITLPMVEQGIREQEARTLKTIAQAHQELITLAADRAWDVYTVLRDRYEHRVVPVYMTPIPADPPTRWQMLWRRLKARVGC